MKIERIPTYVSNACRYICKSLCFCNLNRGGYKYKVSVVAIVKNEGDYIKEWIDFHLKAGVDHFYVYDNESTDNTVNIMKPYIEKGIITLTSIKGRAKQLPAYNDAIERFKNETEFMAIIDGDEFLMAEEGKGLYDVIKDILSKDSRARGIAVNWRMYGSSGHVNKPEGGVLKNFTYRAKAGGTGNGCIKTIVNPRYVAFINHVHYPRYIRTYHSINEDGDIVKTWFNKCGDTKRIRINHYFTKSQEEWIKRRSLGKADHATNKDNRTLEEFKAHDNNDVFDDIAWRIFNS